MENVNWDWEKFIFDENEHSEITTFKKRKVLAKLIFQKMTLLNDRFKVPNSLSAFAPPESCKNPTKYNKNAQES